MNKRLNINGFTLLEMMIVVAIVAILAAFAFPAYQNYVLEANRVEARNQLQAAAQRLEQNFTVNRSYTCAAWKVGTDGSYTKNSDGDRECDTPINTTWLENSGYGTVPSGATGNQIRYNISFVTVPTSRTYTLQAEPANIQTNDSCGTFTINQSNVKAIEGESSTRSAKTRDCWGF